jgi:hypothetical protein
MTGITTATIAEQIRTMLADQWEIHVDERISFQIPGRPSMRRARTVKSYSVYAVIYDPVILNVYLGAGTLSQLKALIDSGALWDEVVKEFKKQAAKMTPDDLEKLGVKLPAIGRKQLALTYNG